MREPISKKTRFEIFKRDLFVCQYCGSHPPGVILEVDHIVPVSKNGANEVDNLITSCFDCNRGKAGNELFCVIESTNDKLIVLKEAEAQYTEYKKYLVKNFIKELGVDEVVEAMSRSCYRFDENASIKYFCGICWNKIREGNNG